LFALTALGLVAMLGLALGNLQIGIAWYNKILVVGFAA